MDSWDACRQASGSLVDALRRVNKLVESASEAVADGNPSALDSVVERLNEAIAELTASLSSIAASVPARPTPDEFASAIELVAKSAPEHSGAMRKDRRIVTGATVIRVTATNAGEIIVTVGSHTLRTTSAARVLDEAARQNRDKFDQRKVVKALKDALHMHTLIRGSEAAEAVVALEDLRKLISISRDSTTYTAEQLTDDIQRLVSTHREAMTDAGIEFVPVPAAKFQFEYIETSGNISHLGGMRLSRNKRA